MDIICAQERIGGIFRTVVKTDGNFDVEKTFDCGQSFRFDRVEDSIHATEYSGVAFGRVVSFGQDGDTLYIYNSTEEDFRNIWRAYLGLNVDYREIDDYLLSRTHSAPFSEAVAYGSGIRILKQDTEEAIFSFIISQNNNIPRIKQIVERLSSLCGTPIAVPEEMESHLSGRSSLCAFPSAEALMSLGVDGLFAAKTGFRAKYIYDAAEKICSGEFDLGVLEALDSTADGLEYLCRIKGVGPKVASCALLFSCARFDAFPVDVWIKKAMQKYFPSEDFDPEIFGRYAGVAQQYLFYYERYLGGEKVDRL